MPELPVAGSVCGLTQGNAMLKLRRAAAVFAVSAAMILATPAICADAAPNPHSLELAKKLFADMHMDTMMTSALSQMTPALVAQMRQSNPNLSEAEARIITDVVTASTSDMIHKVMDRAAPLYAETFTEKELQDLTDFYNTPSGQAMLAKMPVLMSKMTPIVTELMPEMTADIRTRLCAKVACPKTNTPPKPGT